MIKEHTIKTYTIDSHPDKDKVYDWIRSNWHDLNEHSLQEFVDSFKALARELGTTCDYQISQVPDRGQFLKLGEYYPETLDSIPDGCSLTGVCWDDTLLEALKAGHLEGALDSLHRDTEYQYSDQALFELCEANEYEFKADGSIYHG